MNSRIVGGEGLDANGSARFFPTDRIAPLTAEEVPAFLDNEANSDFIQQLRDDPALINEFAYGRKDATNEQIAFAKFLGQDNGANLGALEPPAPPLGTTPENDFYESARILSSDAGVKAMDNLEAGDGTGMADNGRFGTHGMELLSQKDALDDEFWNKIDPNLTVPQRQELIDAAKTMLQPENAQLLTDFSDGDNIFDKGELQGDISKLNQSAGITVLPATQGTGDCFFLSTIHAMASTPAGKDQLLSLVKTVPDAADNPGGPFHYEVTFPGDPNHKTYSVTPQQLADTPGFSSGDATSRVLEITANQWSLDNGGGGITKGGDGEKVLTLFTGRAAQTVMVTPGSPEAEASLAQAIIDGANRGSPMTVGSNITGKDGQVSEHVLTIEAYDPDTNIVTYSNPWDSSKLYTQDLNDFVKKPNQYIDENGAFSSLYSVVSLEPNWVPSTVKSF